MLGSQPTKMEAHLAPVLDTGRCHACRRCLAREVCKPKAIVRIDRDEPPFVDPSRCLGCRACVVACPFEALHMEGASAP